MSMKNNADEIIELQFYRDEYIKELGNAQDKTRYAENNAEALYALGLTMYSNVYTFESTLFNSFSTSFLDENISLHPEQIKVMNLIDENRGVIFSAPTSFGKTFVIFEYIAKMKPQNVVLVVPTLALIDEYKRKIINQYKNIFEGYKVYLSIEKDKEYDMSQKNIFIVTHDRVVNEEVHDVIKSIDFLVIDEVYKLQKNGEDDDRVLILNLAYYNLVAISKKYVLLAPFIKGVRNLNKLDDEPIFYGTNYSPVVSDVYTFPIIDNNDRVAKAKELLASVNGNTLIYFPTIKELDTFIEELDDTSRIEVEQNELLEEFVGWAKQEIHEKWSVLRAMEAGYLVHHGQLPLGIRMLELDLFNDENAYSRLLCTATLLEGVNTTAENIIITKPARGDGNAFDAFDFYNLVGRTGRLFKHYLGKAYYIKGPNDRPYIKNDALTSIEFELTTDSVDMDINKGDYKKHENFVEFLEKLNINYDTYKQEVASKCRFTTVQYLYQKYMQYRKELLSEIIVLNNNDTKGKLELIRVLYKMINTRTYDLKIQTYIINRLTYLTRTRPNIKSVVDATMQVYSWADINDVIKKTIHLKNSYIEFEFYKRIQVIMFFMQCDRIPQNLIDIIQSKLMRNIEIIYYINAPERKMLKDMGVYDGDIETIINMIGDDYETVGELQNRIRNKPEMLNRVSVVTKYVITRFIN